jgi:hypothetical protein
MMKRTMFVGWVVALSLIVPAGAERIISDFETGSDGWQVKDINCSNLNVVIGTYPVTFIATGGCAGGFIERLDPSGNCFFFDAPAKFLADKSAYVGGRLSFCLRTTMNNWKDGNVVVLAGAGRVVAAEIKPFPTAVWQQFTIPLTACYFRLGNKGGSPVSAQDFTAVLSDLKSLRISGEYGSVVSETTGLDSVMLIPPSFLDIEPNCGIDLADLLIMAAQWLQVPTDPAADLWPDCRIDLSDFAILAERWLAPDPECFPLTPLGGFHPTE